MTLEEEYTLSCYEDVTRLVPDKDVWLVRSREDGQFYVKKYLRQGDADVYRRISDAAIPGIPAVFFCAKDADRLVVVEAFVHGRTLGDVIRQKGCFHQGQAARTGLALCRIVSALHAMEPPIIHRDIKPSNVLCSQEGAVWMIDFHAARSYQPGHVQDTQLLGTPAFAAPEQYGFGQSDGRTDIYGLGVTLNYMCTGQPPKYRLAEEPLGSIVTRCTQLDPAARYQTVEELARALQEVAVTDPAPGPADSPAANVAGGPTEGNRNTDCTTADPTGPSATGWETNSAADAAQNPTRGWTVGPSSGSAANSAADVMTGPATGTEKDPAAGSAVGNASAPTDGWTAAASSGAAANSAADVMTGPATGTEKNPAAGPAASATRATSSAWRRFLPVGFRSGRLWKMALGILGYALIAYVSFDTVFTDDGIPMTGPRLLLNRIFVFLTLLGLVQWGGNYLSVRRYFPGMGYSRPLDRILSVLYALVLAFCMSMTVVILEWMLGYTS